MTPEERDRYLQDCRGLVVAYLETRFQTTGPDAELYTAMLEYPLREAKGLRPAMCIALCRALGGRLEESIPSAATIELFHNAFLIHDDVEDGSELRRDKPSLHHSLGEAFAINVGDAMLAHSLQPLLENMKLLDVGRALEILDLVAEMSRISAEGQAMELAWIRDMKWDISAADYIQMVTKKTAWYTFVTPLQMGAIIAERQDLRTLIREFALPLGIAFQIQDDVLNLEAEETTGKEAAGDLWEGKRTLILSHFFEHAPVEELARAKEILSRPRPTRYHIRIREVLDELRSAAELTDLAAATISKELLHGALKTGDDVAHLSLWVRKTGSIRAAKDVAKQHAEVAHVAWDRLRKELDGCQHTDFLSMVAKYVIERSW